MPASADGIAKLKDLQRSLLDPFIEAQRANDTARMRALEALNVEIGLAIDQLTLHRLRDAAAEVSRLTAKVTGAVASGDAAAADDFEPFAHAGEDGEDVAPIPPDAPPAATPTGADGSYLDLWRTATVRPEWADIARKQARRMVAAQARYAAAVGEVGFWVEA